jgi:type I restriction enzyme R subunit
MRLFMRDVRSAQYFEQMKAAACAPSPAPTSSRDPSATAKTRFVHRRRGRRHRARVRRPTAQPRQGGATQEAPRQAANLTITEDETATLASRLAKLEQLTPEERTELDEVAGGSVRDLVRDLVDAVDPDIRPRRSKVPPTPFRPAVTCSNGSHHPAANPDLRTRILELRATHDRIVDEVSVDVPRRPHEPSTPTGPSRSSSPGPVPHHRDEITAILLITAKNAASPSPTSKNSPTAFLAHLTMSDA